MHELVFTCPIISNEMDFSIKSLIDGESEHIRNVLLQANNGIPGNIKEYLLNNTGCDIKVCVLWMEIMEDFDRLPFSKSCMFQNDYMLIDAHHFVIRIINNKQLRSVYHYCASLEEWTISCHHTCIWRKVCFLTGYYPN